MEVGLLVEGSPRIVVRWGWGLIRDSCPGAVLGTMFLGLESGLEKKGTLDT